MHRLRSFKYIRNFAISCFTSDLHTISVKNAHICLQRFLIQRLITDGNCQWIESAILILLRILVSPECSMDSTEVTVAVCQIHQSWSRTLDTETTHSALIVSTMNQYVNIDNSGLTLYSSSGKRSRRPSTIRSMTRLHHGAGLQCTDSSRRQGSPILARSSGKLYFS